MGLRTPRPTSSLRELPIASAGRDESEQSIVAAIHFTTHTHLEYLYDVARESVSELMVGAPPQCTQKDVAPMRGGLGRR